MVIFLLSSKKCNVNLAIFEKKDKEERGKRNGLEEELEKDKQEEQ
jgi:hypothetical protein